MNYMNYNFDGWENMFSQGQVALMINTLNTTSNNLINGATINDVSDLSNQNNISISPNPNHGNFHVSVGVSGLHELNICDIFGRRFSTGKQLIENTGDFDFKLDPGIYFLEVRSAGGVTTKKFLVE